MSGSERRTDLQRQRKHRLLRGTALVVAALAGFWLTWIAVGPDPNSLDVFPPEILGTWRSPDPRYADRAIVVLQDELQLQLGEGDASVHRVRELRRTEDDDYIAYEFSYFTADGATSMELRVMPDGTARLKNPPDVVWSRVPR
jgi:hypothetical protein